MSASCQEATSVLSSGLVLTLRSDRIVSRQRPSDPLQLEFAYWLDLHRLFDGYQ